MANARMILACLAMAVVMNETVKDPLSHTEDALYGRMVQNAFKGFIKSAAVAAVIGALVGAALFGMGVLPDSLASMATKVVGENMWAAGALTGAVAFLTPAGAFGAVAGIQSTRDARRYFQGDVIGLTQITRERDVLRQVEPVHLDVTHDHAQKLREAQAKNITAQRGAGMP